MQYSTNNDTIQHLHYAFVIFAIFEDHSHGNGHGNGHGDGNGHGVAMAGAIYSEIMVCSPERRQDLISIHIAH